MWGSQRHRDLHMSIVGYIHTVNQAKVVDVDRDFRVVNFLERIDDAFIDVASRSEEHTSELQSLMRISYAVFCLKKKKITSIPKQSIIYHIQYEYVHNQI